MEKISNTKIVETKLSHLKDIDCIQKSYEHEIIPIDSISNDFKYSNYYYISAIKENNVIGFAGISLMVDHADLLGIIVDKKYSRQGIASLLLENLISFCIQNSINKIFLEVRKSNLPAINLYTKCGFNQISIRKNYYKDNNEDALIYMKEL